MSFLRINMREIGAKKFSSANVSIASLKRGYQAPNTNLQMVVGGGPRAALVSFPNLRVQNINIISKISKVQDLPEDMGT